MAALLAALWIGAGLLVMVLALNARRWLLLLPGIQHNLEHVLKPWAILAGFAVVCTALTALAQKRKDTV